VKWIIPLLISIVLLGCSNKQVQQLAIETMENAQVSIKSAENVGAHDVATNELNAALEMLTSADSALRSGDAERTYRLALRAYLHARIATEKSLAVRQESQVQEAQAALELQQQATTEIQNNLQTLKAERDAQMK